MRCLYLFQGEDYFNSIPQMVTNDTKDVVESESAPYCHKP